MTLHVGLFVMLSVVNLPLLRSFGAQQQDVLNDHPWKRIRMGYAIFFIQGNFLWWGFWVWRWRQQGNTILVGHGFLIEFCHFK